MAAAGEGAGDKQQRVTGQKGHDDQPGLKEDDRKYQAVHPHAVMRDQAREVLIQMQNTIEQGRCSRGWMAANTARGPWQKTMMARGMWPGRTL